MYGRYSREPMTLSLPFSDKSWVDWFGRRCLKPVLWSVFRFFYLLFFRLFEFFPILLQVILDYKLRFLFDTLHKNGVLFLNLFLLFWLIYIYALRRRNGPHKSESFPSRPTFNVTPPATSPDIQRRHDVSPLCSNTPPALAIYVCRPDVTFT